MIRFIQIALGLLCLLYSLAIVAGMIAASIYINGTLLDLTAMWLIGSIFALSGLLFGLLIIEMT